jgi:toxin HigB-1
MINTFADTSTQDIYDGINSKDARKIPQEIWSVCRRKLDMINAANELRDLASPPGNRLESLKGSLKGYWSIRINDQYRVIFKFNEGSASEVKIADYH